MFYSPFVTKEPVNVVACVELYFWICYIFCIYSTPGLHNSENSKGQIGHINLPRASKSLSFCC